MYVILMKVPFYKIPQTYSGDISSGPYNTVDQAQSAIAAYLRERIDPNCQEGYEKNFEIFKLEKMSVWP